MIFGKFLRALSNPSATIYVFCQKYIKRYEGFNYDFNRNGESHILKSLKGFLDKGIVFDVGANRGHWACMFSNIFPKISIYSFEPSPSTFKNFLVPATSSVSTIKAFNKGLGSTSGTLPFKEYIEGDTLSSFVVDANFHSHESYFTYVDVVSGDEFCLANKISTIDFLKIDVEGFEFEVLDGFKDMISKKAIQIIQFEYGYTNADAGHTLKDFFSFLSSKGYIVGPLKPYGVIFMDFDYALNNFNSGPNFVAVSGENLDLIELLRGPSIKYYPHK